MAVAALLAVTAVSFVVPIGGTAYAQSTENVLDEADVKIFEGSGGELIYNGPEVARAHIGGRIGDCIYEFRRSGGADWDMKLVVASTGNVVIDFGVGGFERIADYQRAYQRPYSECGVAGGGLAGEGESALSTTEESASFLSRAVVNRVLALRPAGGGGFRSPASGAAAAGSTGLSAGDEPLPDYPANVSVDVSYGKTRLPGRFETRSAYAVSMTDTLLDWDNLFGYGVGVEQVRESLLGGASKRTRGITATAYMAQILDDNFTLVPQASLSYLLKKRAGDRDNAGRAMLSLTVLGQEAVDAVELSGFGQLVYSHEKPFGDGRRIYLGQAVAGAELAMAMPDGTGAQPFVGMLADYDLTRSETDTRKKDDEKFGWEASAGLRSVLETGTAFTATVSHARKGDERSTTGSVFVKFFF